MKKIVLSLALAGISLVSFAQKSVSTIAKFTTETIDMGKIKQGNPTKGTFTVKNIGSSPLIIEQANPTCGCTISNYTKEPIAPGKSGTIDATYNAANPGSFTKHLTVKFAGADSTKSITLTGEVLSAEEYAKWEAANPGKPKPAAEAKPSLTTTPASQKQKIKKPKS
ncbi:MAG: DUF1573 domain-containing protein [Bacteroidota bacterium]